MNISLVVPAKAGTHNPNSELMSQTLTAIAGNLHRAHDDGRGVWVPAFAGTTG